MQTRLLNKGALLILVSPAYRCIRASVRKHHTDAPFAGFLYLLARASVLASPTAANPRLVVAVSSGAAIGPAVWTTRRWPELELGTGSN